MELIIAILWWIGLLVPGTYYTQDQVDMIINDNQDVINQVQSDAVQSQQALDWYWEHEQDVIEFYDPIPYKPIR